MPNCHVFVRYPRRLLKHENRISYLIDCSKRHVWARLEMLYFYKEKMIKVTELPEHRERIEEIEQDQTANQLY